MLFNTQACMTIRIEHMMHHMTTVVRVAWHKSTFTFSINYIILWLWYCQSFQQMFTFCSPGVLCSTLSHFQNHMCTPPFPLHLFSLFIFLVICIFVSNYSVPMHLWWLKKSKEKQTKLLPYLLASLSLFLFTHLLQWTSKCIFFLVSLKTLPAWNIVHLQALSLFH
jgi:hypothetical protein